MRFKIGATIAKHAAISTGISLAAYGIGHATGQPSELLLAAGPLWFASRELRDIEKSHAWSMERWNCAELVFPVIASGALYFAIGWI